MTTEESAVMDATSGTMLSVKVSTTKHIRECRRVMTHGFATGAKCRPMKTSS